MKYRCSVCEGEFEFPPLKKGVLAVCPECHGPLVESGPDPNEGAFLVELDEAGSEVARYEVTQGSRIGRSEECSIVLADPSVSNVHAEVLFSGGRLCLQDRESTNGTYVNGLHVNLKTLVHGDTIDFGKVRVVFRAPRSSSPRAEADPALTLLHSEDGSAPIQAEYRPGSTVAAPPGEARFARLQRALELTAELATILEKGPLLDRLAGNLVEMFGVERVIVLLQHPRRGGLSVALARDAAGKPLPSLNLSRTLVRKVVGERTALVTGDVLTDSRLPASGSLLATGIRSALIAPLLYRDEVWGLVWADTSAAVRSFGEEDLPIFAGLVGVAAVSLANAKLYRRVAREARTREHLSRYLAPQLVQQVMKKKLGLEMGGEQREVTVLFSDLRGFTAITETLDGEDVVKMLNHYFTRMVEVIFEHGGMVDKFIGDAIMAVWGVPVASESDPYRAVRGAIGMQRALEELNREASWGPVGPLRMGIGLHTGPVLAGNMGSPRRMEYTVIGDTVNTASRIEAATGAGDVYLSRQTQEHLAGAIPVRPLPPIVVKNKSRPLELFAVDFDDLSQDPGSH